MNTGESTDHLTITIDPVEESPIGGVYFLVRASVNGEPLSDVLDVDEFFKSVAPLDSLVATQNKKSSKARLAPITERLPLFNCTCGFFGCGGYYVDVTVTTTALLWESTFIHTSSQPPRRFTFSWENIRTVSEAVIYGIINAMSQYPKTEIGSGVMSGDLAKKLPLYRQQLDNLITITDFKPVTPSLLSG